MQVVKRNGLMVHNFTPISVVILAGGRSLRMGTPKAKLVTPGGVSLLDRACILGRALLCSLKQDESRVYVSGEYPGFRCIPDVVPQCGPLSGIHAGLRYCLQNCVSQYMLVFPVDMPALSVPVLLQLVQSGVGKVATTFCDHEMPLLLKIDKTVQEILARRLESSEISDRSIHKFLTELGASSCQAPVNATSEFLNLNTPDEFSEFIKDSFVSNA